MVNLTSYIRYCLLGTDSVFDFIRKSTMVIFAFTFFGFFQYFDSNMDPPVVVVVNTYLSVCRIFCGVSLQSSDKA